MSARPGRVRVGVGLVIALVAVAVMIVASLTLGARPIPLATVVEALTNFDPNSNDHSVVVGQRVPRTIIGLLAGSALAAAGTLMQGLTRNPFADPGLLGINAGASFGVIGAISLLGVSQTTGYVWFSFIGAAVAAVAVAAIGGAGADGQNPAKLALTGAAVTAGLTSVTMFIVLTRAGALDAYREWTVGALTGRPFETVVLMAPPIILGLLLALASARGLDLLALGESAAHGLGHSATRTRIVGIVATVLLCGGATAIAGPIVFLGLLVPHALRALVGPGYPRLMILSPLVGAAVLLLADVVGRLVALPGEVQAGVVVALLGAPVLIALTTRTKRALV